MRCLAWSLFFLAWLTAGARADFAQDLARIHTEAIGGEARVQALRSLKASGVTRIQGKELRFVMWAARPNLIRTEVTAEGRVSTQAYNGRDRPWVRGTRTEKVVRMNGEMAAEFRADAEFDDPLVVPTRPNVSLDYAGEAKVAGRPAFKVLVTQNFSQSSYVYLDATTYFLVRREVVRKRGGVPVRIITDYADFRAVGGVMVPHRMTVSSGGELMHETVLEAIESNVRIPSGWFDAPEAK